MDRKKLIIIIILIVFILAIIIASILLLKDREEPTKVISEPLNENVILSDVFNKLEKLQNEEISGEMLDIKEDKNSEEEIDFKKYEVLEKKAIVNTTEQQVDEIWMIKLGDMGQQEEVCRILGNRVQKLKNTFKDDKEQMAILENAVIKQEDGIVIMIISKDLEKIEKTISEEMK